MAVQNKMNLQTAPIRTYLDSTVVPVLLQGLSALVKERCSHPPATPSPRSRFEEKKLYKTKSTILQPAVGRR